MNKFISLLALAAICSFSSAQANTCTKDTESVFTGIVFQDLKDGCVTQTEKQIKTEIEASFSYLAMGAYFARDDVNRPGFSKLFFEAASEEREHAYKLIEYLSMRGRYLRSAYKNADQTDSEKWNSLIPSFEISKFVTDIEDLKVESGLDALKVALTLETKVTKHIRELIQKCETGFNQYHFVDYLTGEFLEEQYKGQRDLAGKIATLGKMVNGQGKDLAEYLFDKQLL